MQVLSVSTSHESARSQPRESSRNGSRAAVILLSLRSVRSPEAENEKEDVRMSPSLHVANMRAACAVKDIRGKKQASIVPLYEKEVRK